MNWRPEEGWKNDWDSEREHDGMLSKAEIFEAGADAIVKKLKEKGMFGEVKAHSVGPVDENGHTDDFDTVFTSEDGVEIILNGAEDVVYGKATVHIIEPKKGWLIFIECEP